LNARDAETAAGNEVHALLAAADDPLLLGIRAWTRMTGPFNQPDLLVAVLQRHGRQCSVAAAREIARLAHRLVRRADSDPRALLAALSASEVTAAFWLRASLLEALGAYGEALTILEKLPDPDLADGRATRLLACARTRMACAQPGPAAADLREAIRCASSYRMLQEAGKLVDRLAQLGDSPFKREARIALVGSTTLDLLAPVLHALAFGAGLRADLFVGAINQYQQEILDARSPLSAFGPDVVILAPHWESLGLTDDDSEPETTVAATVAMLRELWRRCRDHFGAVVLQHNFEIPAEEPYGRLSRALPGGRSRVLQRINLALWDAENDEHDVAIVDLEHAAAWFGKAAWSDPALWHTAKQYPAVDATLPLLRQDLAALQALWGLNAKCLALDLDNTLWGGVIGEDGLAGIELGGTGVGGAYSAFQRYVQGLGRRGVILCVCSKNNPDDVQQVFRDHPEMVLRADDVALFEVGWQPKDEGLRHIAEVLNIGLDSIVFVDDSPQEREWVRQRLPEVIVPELPADPALFVRSLADGLYFESLTLTAEDRQRSRAYQQNRRRDALHTSSTSLDDFLRSLEMRVDLRPFDEVDLLRIVQLINKTNQFNVTTRRRSEAEIRRLMARPDVYTQAVRVTDRFGDNGLTGVLIAKQEAKRFIIDTWLLSCRVMGRRVEHVMLASLFRHAGIRRLDAVEGELIVTAKNAPVHDLFDRLGFAAIDLDAAGNRRYERSLVEDCFAFPAFIQVEDHTTVDDMAGRPVVEVRDDG
jgi:FkbH-like protein